MSLALSISILFISLLQLINGAQFLNINPLFLSSACLAANDCVAVLDVSGFCSGPASLVIFILPLTNMYASL